MDWTVGGIDGLVDSGVDALAEVPVVGTAAAMEAPVTKFGWEMVGGAAKGLGDMVGGLANIAADPLGTLVGLNSMAEHIPCIGAPFQAQHALYDLAVGNKSFEETCLGNPIDMVTGGMVDDYDYWTTVSDAMAEPYKQAIEQGKYGEALGRGAFDIAAFFLGGGEAKSLGEGAEVAYGANKVDDAVKVASKATPLGPKADEIAAVGNKVDVGTKVASDASEVADLGRAEDATTLATPANDLAIPLPAEGDQATVAATTPVPSPAPPE